MVERFTSLGALLKDRGLSIARAATLTGYSASAIHRLNQGRVAPTVMVAHRLAGLLNVTEDYLVSCLACNNKQDINVDTRVSPARDRSTDSDGFADRYPVATESITMKPLAVADMIHVYEVLGKTEMSTGVSYSVTEIISSIRVWLPCEVYAITDKRIEAALGHLVALSLALRVDGQGYYDDRFILPGKREER